MLSARRDIPLQCGCVFLFPRSLSLSLSLSISLSLSLSLAELSLSPSCCRHLRGDKQAATAQLVAPSTLVCTLYNAADDDADSGVQLYPSYYVATMEVNTIAVTFFGSLKKEKVQKQTHGSLKKYINKVLILPYLFNLIKSI